jgi:hypothetical protein
MVINNKTVSAALEARVPPRQMSGKATRLGQPLAVQNDEGDVILLRKA